MKDKQIGVLDPLKIPRECEENLIKSSDIKNISEFKNQEYEIFNTIQSIYIYT